MVKINKTLCLDEDFVKSTEDYCDGTARNFSKLVELSVKEYRINHP